VIKNKTVVKIMIFDGDLCKFFKPYSLFLYRMELPIFLNLVFFYLVIKCDAIYPQCHRCAFDILIVLP